MTDETTTPEEVVTTEDTTVEATPETTPETTEEVVVE